MISSEDPSNQSDLAAAKDAPSRIGDILRLTIYLIACVLLSFIIISFWFHPDALAAITIIPIFAWIIVGIVIALLAHKWKYRRITLITIIVWLALWCIFSDEPISLLRAVIREDTAVFEFARKEGKSLRVVSLNCAGGNPDAAREVAAFHPDIVLLQETPAKEDVAKLAKELFGNQGGYCWGLDGVIIANGQVTAAPIPVHDHNRSVLARRGIAGVDSVHTRVSMASGAVTEVVSLRLLPPVFRFDLFSPECYREQTQNRILRRKQLSTIYSEIVKLPDNSTIIFGGDFNAPARDGIFQVLQPKLHDSFREGGKGWGNTIGNDTPFSRIDQIWISKNLRAISVRAIKTKNSDHRMVVCDLVYK
jgi:vancomycin resistance protein VanJ